MSLNPLRPYQLEALENISKCAAAGTNRLLMKMPTGGGKTRCFAELPKWPAIKTWLETFPEGQRKMLVIAHREELLDQASKTITEQNPGLMVSIEQGERVANRYSDVIIASIQTLQASKFKRLKTLLRTCKFRIVIIDEAHHAAAPTYRTALVHLGFLPPADVSDTDDIEAANETDVAEMAKNLADWDARAPKDQLLVGVTATPNRSDAIGLGCVFQTIAHSYALKTAIDDKWLVPIVPWVVETKSTLDDVGTNRGDFNQRELADAVNNAHRNALAVEAWATYAGDQPTLAFTVDVAHAHALAEAFQVCGITAKAISGETPKDERRATLAAYTRGEIQVITNCMVLTEGTDLPRTGCILHAKPTKSATLYEQMTGRGLRLYPDKKECVVIDLVDIARRHSLQTAPVLYGLPPGIKADGKDLGTLENELEEFLKKHPGFNIDGAGRKTMDELNAWASTFDVWAVPELGAFGAGRALNWIKSGVEEYRLQYPWQEGTETLTVAPDLLGHYAVSLTLRTGAYPNLSVRQRTLAMEIQTAQAAAGLAEAFVLQERRAVMKLKATDAPWRQRDASEKQIAMLQRLRVAIKPGLKSGEASDLIDLAQARRKR